jgi:hypothetical protein
VLCLIKNIAFEMLVFRSVFLEVFAGDGLSFLRFSFVSLSPCRKISKYGLKFGDELFRLL